MNTKHIVLIIVILIALTAIPVFFGKRVAKNEDVQPWVPPGSEAPTQNADKPVQTATPVAVEISGFAFKSGTITIKKGTPVTWTNQDTAPHTATSDIAGAFDSGLLNKGDSFTFTFNKTGTFSYICSFHPAMRGTIIVTD